MATPREEKTEEFGCGDSLALYRKRGCAIGSVTQTR